MEIIFFTCKVFCSFKKLLHSKCIVSFMKQSQPYKADTISPILQPRDLKYSLRDCMRLLVNKWQHWDLNSCLLTPCVGLTQLPPFLQHLYSEQKSLFVSIYSNQVSLKWGNTIPIGSSSLLVFCNLVVQKKVWVAETFYHASLGWWSHSGCGTRRKCHH